VPGRVALVAPRYAPWIGGTERHVAQLGAGLHRRGVDVEVVTTDPTGRLPPEQEMDGILVRRFRTLADDSVYCVAPALGAWLVRHARHYTLLHAHSYHTPVALQAAVASRLAGVPLVLSLYYHGTGHSALRRALHLPYRLPGRWMLRQARGLTCLSNAERDLIQRHFAPPVEADIVPSAVDSVALRAAQPRQAMPHRTVVLAVNRLDTYKQTDRLVMALTYLPDEYVAVIVGDGPQRASLDALAVRLGLTDRLLVLPRVERGDLLAWYARADLFVSLSRHETFGLAVLEAAVAGAPVLASDIPAHRETASFVPTDRVRLTSVSADAARLARDIVEMARLGRATSIDGWPLPTLDRTADGTLECYRRVIPSQPRVVEDRACVF